MCALKQYKKQARQVKDANQLPDLSGPSVVSISQECQTNGDGLKALELIAQIGVILEDTAATVRAGRGFIGHIKALLSTPDGASTVLSVVRDRVQSQKGLSFVPQEPINEFVIAITAIVYGYSQDELRHLVKLGLTKCSNFS